MWRDDDDVRCDGDIGVEKQLKKIKWDRVEVESDPSTQYSKPLPHPHIHTMGYSCGWSYPLSLTPSHIHINPITHTHTH